jgi:mono/diheme cytochrome c family protein
MHTPRPIRIPPSTSLWLVVFFFGSFLTMAGCAEQQSQQATETPQTEAAQPDSDPIASGKASYDQYCISCHGADGKGTGELAGDLATPPADLTRLRSKNGGTFPQDAIFRTIDGAEDVEAHGPREMPVWGNIWSEEGGEPVPRETIEQRINELVEYIRSIQE